MPPTRSGCLLVEIDDRTETFQAGRIASCDVQGIPVPLTFRTSSWRAGRLPWQPPPKEVER